MFFDLQADTLAAYVEENRKFQGMWLFHHIPKTAGSSLAAELSVQAAPFLNILPDYHDTDVPFAVRLDDAVRRFLRRAAEGDSGAEPALRSASGHLTSQYIRQIETRRPDTRMFTFLRHPVSRIVSEYTYNRSPLHPPHLAFRDQYPTLADFAGNPEEHNKMSYFMFGRFKIDVPEALAEMGRRYRVIGLQERYPASFLLLSSAVWEPALPKVRERVSAGSETPEVSDALRKSILATNQLDLALFTAVDAVYTRIAPAIWRDLKPAPPV